MRPQRRRRIEDTVDDLLKEVSLVRADSEMAQLHLRLGPCESGRAVESGGVMVLIHQIHNLLAGGSDQCPEGDARGRARLESNLTAQAEDRIEDGAGGVGQRSVCDHRHRLAKAAPAPEEARPIGFELQITDGLSFDEGYMRRPSLGVARGLSSPPSQYRAHLVGELRLHEQIGECGMRIVACVRRQYDFRVGGQRDISDLASIIGDRHPANFSVVLRRNGDFQHRGDRIVPSDEFRPTLRKSRFVFVGLDRARLIGRGP